MNAQPENYTEELLADLLSVVEQSLLKRGVPNDVAHQASVETVESLRHQWGGTMLYFPQGYVTELSQRDLQLFDEFNGYNHKQLAAKYDVCEDRVYKIVKRVRMQQLRLRQTDIFDDAAGKGS